MYHWKMYTCYSLDWELESLKNLLAADLIMWINLLLKHTVIYWAQCSNMKFWHICILNSSCWWFKYLKCSPSGGIKERDREIKESVSRSESEKDGPQRHRFTTTRRGGSCHRRPWTTTVISTDGQVEGDEIWMNLCIYL